MIISKFYFVNDKCTRIMNSSKVMNTKAKQRLLPTQFNLKKVLFLHVLIPLVNREYLYNNNRFVSCFILHLYYAFVSYHNESLSLPLHAAHFYLCAVSIWQWEELIPITIANRIVRSRVFRVLHHFTLFVFMPFLLVSAWYSMVIVGLAHWIHKSCATINNAIIPRRETWRIQC